MELCIVAHLKQYIKMTEVLLQTNYLLSFVPPYKPVSTTTLSGWCVIVMKESGRNVNIFVSHLTRSASTSNCKISGSSFKEIANPAGWSNEKKFA